MTEIDHDESKLAERLKSHYQQRYEQEPDPSLVWARVLPHLGQQETSQPGLLQRAQELPIFIGRLAARQNAALKETYQEKNFMDEAIHIDQASSAHDPRFTSGKRPLRRRIQHLIEAGIAAVLVASLLLGWFAITRTHPSQGKPTPLFTYTGQPGENVSDFQWMADGKHLTMDMYNMDKNSHRYLVWDAATGKTRQTFAITPPPDTSTAPGSYITDSPDGRYALIRLYGTSNQAGAIKLLNILTGHIEWTYQGHNLASAISNDSKYVAFVGDDGHIRFWDIVAGKVVLTSDPIGVPHISFISWSDDNKRIIDLAFPLTPDKPRVIQEWSAQTGHRLANVVESPTMSLMPGFTDLGGFSPDGLRVLTFNTQAGTFEIRESSTLKILQVFHVQLRISGSTLPSGTYAGSYVAPSWLGNGERIILGKDNKEYVWDTTTGKLVATYSQVGAPESVPEVWAARYEEVPYIAFWQQGKPFVVKNVVTNATVSSIALSEKPSQISQIYWTEHGKHLHILFNRNAQGQIYDTVSGRLIASYQGDFAELSPDEKYLAVATEQTDPKTGHALKSTLEILPVH